MKLTKEQRTALLIAFYLTRAGTARIEDISYNLSIPEKYLRTVINKLVKQDLLVLNGNEVNFTNDSIRFLDILQCYDFMDMSIYKQHIVGQPEQRALTLYVNMLIQAVIPVLNEKINTVMQKLVNKEVAYLDKLDNKGLEN